MATEQRRGLMFVLSSPSGAGKSTLSRALLASDPDIALSVSATTRPMRAGEVDGRDYYFVDRARFDAMVSQGAFLEWAKVFDNRYGTPRAPVEAMLDQGRDVLFDIDWQGTQQLHQARPEDLVRVFILPPSIAALHARLHSRAQDSADVIAGRMARAAGEISHWAEYDYVLVNDDLEDCLSRLKIILAAERLKRQRQTGLSEFVRTLMAEA
ncbi:MAG: guanylate kinase [Sphingomonadales bacterium]|nr:MAG: guanylate kinase [Sphingomonadales bacterium]